MHRRPERCNTPSSAKSTTRKRSSPAKVLLGFHESYGYKVPDASGSEATHRGVAKNERKGLRREAGKASSAATARRHRRYPVPERSFRVWLPKFSRSKISGFCENTSARQVFFIFGWTLNASFRSFAKNSLLHSVFLYLFTKREYDPNSLGQPTVKRTKQKISVNSALKKKSASATTFGLPSALHFSGKIGYGSA